jgi:hypothetical protein
MSDVQRHLQKCFVQLQSAFDTIPNSAGTATLAGSDACLIISLDTDRSQEKIERPDKSGTLDSVPSQRGKRMARAKVTMSMAGNGAAGSKPDCDEFLQAAFGKAATVVASTSATYAIDDTIYYLTVWHFNDPANASQMVLFNGVVTAMELNFGGNVPTLTFEIEGGWVYDNDQASDGTTPAAAKGGLSAMPAVPATPVVNGTHPRGWEVTFTFDGTAYSTLQSGRIRVEYGRSLRKNTNSEFPKQATNGRRRVFVEFTMTDADDSTLRATKLKQVKGTRVNMTFVIGATAGNIWTWVVINVELGDPKYGDGGNDRTLTFGQSEAFPSALNAKDHLTCAIT